jgi:hypothetical protein
LRETGLIIRIFLLLFFSALILLLAAKILNWLGLTQLAAFFLQLGDDVLLASFTLLLISGLILIAKRIGASIKVYFSASQQAQRKFLFSLAKAHYLQRLCNSQKQQLHYFTALKRKRLLEQDNKKQQQRLIKAMQKELNQVKNKLSVTEFESYQQQIKNFKYQPENVGASPPPSLVSKN